MSLKVAETVAREKSRTNASHMYVQKNSNKSGFAVVGSGVGLITIGWALLSLAAPLWAVLLIIPGMVLIFAGLDHLSQTFRRPLYSRGFCSLRGGTMSMRRESEREAAKEKKVESGEDD